jgi:hypothetical protein
LSYFYHPESFSHLSAVFAKILVPLSARSWDKIITVSRNSMKDIVQVLGIPRHRVCVIYEAVSEYSAMPADHSKRELMAKYGIRDTFILTVAASHPHNNLRRLVEAYHTVRTDYSIQHQLVLVGLKGRDHPPLMNLIADLSLQGMWL